MSINSCGRQRRSRGSVHGDRPRFEIDAEFLTSATLGALAKRGAIEPRLIARAIKDLGIDPAKAHPVCL